MRSTVSIVWTLGRLTYDTISIPATTPTKINRIAIVINPLMDRVTAVSSMGISSQKCKALPRLCSAREGVCVLAAPSIVPEVG